MPTDKRDDTEKLNLPYVKKLTCSLSHLIANVESESRAQMEYEARIRAEIKEKELDDIV